MKLQNKNFSQENEKNPLICLNHALSNRGYHLEIKDNYKFKKALIIYNLFTKDLKDSILNSRNEIKVGKNSELHTIDFIINESKYKFVLCIYRRRKIKSKYSGAQLFINALINIVCEKSPPEAAPLVRSLFFKKMRSSL